MRSLFPIVFDGFLMVREARTMTGEAQTMAGGIGNARLRTGCEIRNDSF